MNTPESFSAFYRTAFVSVYADYVALTLIKPEQVLNEESNALSHFAQFYNPGLSSDKQQGNLDKALNHLIRATIDLHKLTFEQLRIKLDLYVTDDDRRLCFNLPVHEVLNRYKNFMELGREARHFEEKSIGVDTDGTIEKYDEANRAGFALLKAIDVTKVERINKLTTIIRTREFLYGVIASRAAAAIIAIGAWLIGSCF